MNWDVPLIHLFISGLFLQRVDTQILGLPREDASRNPFIASMGVYVFKTEVLLKLLTQSFPAANDFGSEILPSAVKKQNIKVFCFYNSSVAFYNMQYILYYDML